MYDYYSKIHYKIENNFIVKNVFEIKNKIRRFHEIKNLLT